MPSCSETQEALSSAIDAGLLDIIKNGQVVLDDNGQERRVPATAAYYQAAITRLKALGLSKMIQPGDDASELARACGITADTLKFPSAHKLPPVSDEPDERTGT